MALLSGAWLKISTGNLRPPKPVVVPFADRLEIFSTAAAPPTACTYLSITSPAGGSLLKSSFSGGGVAGVGIAGLAISPVMIGIVTGLREPLWQELQVTSRWPSKLSLLMANIIVIIFRATSLGFLSSWSKWPSTWH